MIEILKEHLTRRPFVPFRVVLSGGDRYDIRHPDFAWLVKGGLYVGLPAESPRGESDVPERAVFCSMLHLAGVEQLIGA
jgi:hypothetical protein